MPREPRRAKDRTGDREPATSGETAAEALERARAHARRAVSEAIAAVHALLDAASIGWSGRPSEAHTALRGLSDLLDEQQRRFEGSDGLPTPVMNAILEAVEKEITRWENRASRDGEARAVLRTFLGLREILWEFGLRKDEPTSRGSAESGRRRTKTTSSESGASPQKGASSGERRRRVQRIDVQGQV